MVVWLARSVEFCNGFGSAGDAVASCCCVEILTVKLVPHRRSFAYAGYKGTLMGTPNPKNIVGT